MKKILAVAGSVLVLGLLVGCEDKQAELQQNQRIEAVSSEVLKMRQDIEDIKNENMKLRSNMNLVTDWLRKKIEEEKAKATANVKPVVAPKIDPKGAKPTTGAKTPDPKKKMFP